MSISSRQKCRKMFFLVQCSQPFFMHQIIFWLSPNDWWKTGQLFINRFELSFGSRFCSYQPFSNHWKVEYPYLPIVFRWFDCPVMVIFFSSSIFFPLNSLKLLPPLPLLFPLPPSPPPPQPLTSFHPWRPLIFFLLHQQNISSTKKLFRQKFPVHTYYIYIFFECFDVKFSKLNIIDRHVFTFQEATWESLYLSHHTTTDFIPKLSIQ